MDQKYNISEILDAVNELSNPKFVRYGWKSYFEPNLVSYSKKSFILTQKSPRIFKSQG